MSSARKYLLDIIQQESRLPEINADACVHALLDKADCQACVDVCPTQAWILDDEALGLDTNACDGCGVCIPACPPGALHIQYPWVIRSLSGQTIALFACEKSGIDEPVDFLPCLHALGLRQLLLLYNAGIKYLLIATDDCVGCARHQTTGLQQGLEQLNSLLSERNQPLMKILQRPALVWKKIFATDEVISRGTHLPRRDFLSGGGQLLRHQLVVLDPLNLPEHQTIPLGQLLPTSNVDELHWPWAAQLDQNRCNGCDACIKLCPTDALQLTRNEQDSSPEYQINPASCTGCGICTTVCESQAIFVNRYTRSTAQTISLEAKCCTACGNAFHLPQLNAQAEESLCRVCRGHNHGSNLFQVLAEEQLGNS